MKKSKLNALLFIFLIPCFACSQNDSDSEVVVLQEEVVIEYAMFESHPVEMVYDPNDGRVELRVLFNKDEYSASDYKWLAFLKEEVLRLASANQPVVLGKSGYTFEFLGGHPIWAPYTGWYIDYNCKCLYFANSGSIDGQIIQAQGTKEIEGWNGYELWKLNR